jgi:addiction module HigA family antidote
MLTEERRPVHPGEIIRFVYLEPYKMTQQKLADAIGVGRECINEIILGQRSISTDTAYRLAKFFNTTPDFWIKLQVNIDLWDTLQSHQQEYENIESVT